MLKAAGLVLIITAGAGLGLSESLRLSKREQALAMLLRLVIYLKGEISYGRTSLHDALTGAGQKLPGVYGAFLMALGERMEKKRGCSFGELFRECAGEYLKNLELSEKDLEEFCFLGAQLGYLDLDMQVRQLTLYEQSLTLLLQELKSQLPGRKKVCAGLGILGGLLLAILVW